MTREKWLVDGPKVIDLELVRSLKVGLYSGQIDIVAHDEPGARVEIHHVSGKDLEVSIDGDVLGIDHPQLRWDNFLEVFATSRNTSRADVSIMVPRDTRLKLGVVGAEVLVSGLHADASLSTVSGDVVVDACSGALQLNAVSGDLSVRDHTGTLTAHTVSGELVASGAITRLTADTVGGDVFLDLPGEPDEVRVNTVSGDVTARLSPDHAVQYRISTASGKLRFDDREVRGVRGSYAETYGTLEGRWLEFKVNTVSGAINVLHGVTA